LVVFAAPFSADLIDWLSRTAAEGLASRPIRGVMAISRRLRKMDGSPAVEVRLANTAFSGEVLYTDADTGKVEAALGAARKQRRRSC
jgi:hypothetical protein